MDKQKPEYLRPALIAGSIAGVLSGLPFVSAGGSSLLASFLMLGLLISVAQRRPVLIAHRPFEFNEEAT